MVQVNTSVRVVLVGSHNSSAAIHQGGSYLWNKVEVHKDGKLIVMEAYSNWMAANLAADKFEQEYPNAEVQLWVRER